MLRIPNCLDNRITDGGKVVSFTHRPRSTPQKHNFSASGTHFSQMVCKLRGLVRQEGIDKFKNSFSSSGLDPATFRLVAQCLNHYATAGSNRNEYQDDYSLGQSAPGA
jgi:hypothetical protein